MPKVSREEQWRREGISFAVNYLKDHTPQELEEEAKRRAAYNIPIGMSKGERTHAYHAMAANCLETVLLIAVSTLRDEFDFGTKRLNRFVERFNNKADCIEDDLVSWDDMVENVRQETGIECPIVWHS